MNRKTLIKKLKNAYVTCHECGIKYGVYNVKCSCTWKGTCDICGELKSITESRDYAYFVTGIRKLSIEDTIND
jgi:predicted ATP-dependent serine protease